VILFQQQPVVVWPSNNILRIMRAFPWIGDWSTIEVEL